MQLNIKTPDFLEAIKQLKKMAPSRRKALFLYGMVSIQHAQQIAIFSIGPASQICEAQGVWAGKVSFPFPILTSFLKVPPKHEVVTITFIDGKVKIDTVSVQGHIVYS
jgi:hypothetical protein